MFDVCICAWCSYGCAAGVLCVYVCSVVYCIIYFIIIVLCGLLNFVCAPVDWR